MAGDWIKMELNLHEKPEVIQIAGELGLDRFSVVGMLHRVWGWFDTHTEDGNAPSVTGVTVDELVGRNGFATAMKNAGWLEEHGAGVSLPRFDRHNGKTAKNRALTALRVKRSRNADTVTESLPEKRREEKKKENTKRKFTAPTLEEVKAYVQQRNSSVDPKTFWEYFEAADWHDSSGKKVKSWKQKIITWESHGYGQPRQPQSDGSVIY